MREVVGWLLLITVERCASSPVLEDALEGGCFLLSQVHGGILLSAVPPAARMLRMCLKLFAVLWLSFSEFWRTSCLSLQVRTPPCGLSFFVSIQHGSVAISIFFWRVLWAPLKNDISNLAFRGLIFDCLIP